jgi:hypothetical protein
MQTNPNDRVACEDCGWKGTARELGSISDFAERVFPGEICPAGECPDCGALAHLDFSPAIKIVAAS